MISHSDEIPYDGFRVEEDRGFRIRRNVDHIQQCCEAIRRRWKQEANVCAVELYGAGLATIVKLNTKSRKNNHTI